MKNMELESMLRTFYEAVRGLTKESIDWAVSEALKADEHGELTFRMARDIMFEAAERFKIEDWEFAD